MQTCQYCNKKYEWDGIRLHSTESIRYKYNAEKYCSYECHKNARIAHRKKSIEKKHGSMHNFNNWSLRRITQQLRAQGISEEGIKEFKNNQIRKSIEKECEYCKNQYIWDNIRIHPVEGKKKGYNAEKYCSYECSKKARKNKIK